MGLPPPSTTSSSTRSNGSEPMAQLKGAVFVGSDGCEHQEFMQPIQIIHGTGVDAGTVAIQIGEACIVFNSASELIASLGRRDEGQMPAYIIAS